MSVYSWAKQTLNGCLESAAEQSYDEATALRALLSEVIERSKTLRGADDLAQELQFLIDNLDEAQDFAFMRP